MKDAQVLTDKTTQDIADDLKVSTRMVNLYRAAAERVSGKKLGQKRGKTVYFSPADQELIIQSRYNAVDTLKSAAAEDEAKQKMQEMSEISPNFRETGSTLQGELAGGLVEVKESLHGGGLVLGRAVGKEFAKGLRQGIGMELQELIVDLEVVSQNLIAVTTGAAAIPAGDDLPSISGTGAGFW